MTKTKNQKCRICGHFKNGAPPRMEPRAEVVAAMAKLKGVQPPGSVLAQIIVPAGKNNYYKTPGVGHVAIGNGTNQDLVFDVRKVK